MPIITKLKLQKNKKRVNLFLDNKFAFGLGLEKVTKLGLKKGQELKDKEVKDLFYSSQFEKIYFKTLNFLSYRPRSEKEILNYLRKNLFIKQAIANEIKRKLQTKILKKLKKQKLLNDYQFAEWWVGQRLAHRPRGKMFLKAELLQKGIEKEIIDRVLSTINNQQLEILAGKIIDKKMKFYKKLPELKLKQKLFSHLARRGFDFSIIKKLIDEKLKKG